MRLLPASRVFARLRPSHIGLRLLAFNLLVVFVPVAGILYLDVYEAELLENQERGMVQQARLVAAGLANSQTLSSDAVSGLFTALGEQGDARIRVFNSDGQIVGDSARFAARTPAQMPDAYSAIANPRRRVLYRVGAGLVHLRNRISGAIWRVLSRGGTRPPAEAPPATLPEVRSALAGRYGAAIRGTPGQRSLTLSSAVPVRHGGQVTGAVVVSQSTFRILQALYDVRLRLFEIVLLSMASAAVLTWVASSTIVNPIVRLRSMAAVLASRGSDLSGVFGRVDRKDEIGDLARSLEELAARLDAHIKLLESFAADVSHEFRNPLAAIRAAAETVAAADSADDRERFRKMLLSDVDRLEGLVAGVRELARVDTEVSSERRTALEICEVLRNVAHGRETVLGVPVNLKTGPRRILVNASPGPLSQVFENLVDNAASFSPTGVPVEVNVSAGPGQCRVTVRDSGPGIPEAHVDRVFDRFFSYRPNGTRREHMGLGLAIAKAIVTGYGGTIHVSNRAEGGAEFEVVLPTSDSRLTTHD